MSVYVEFVFLDNFVIDWALISLARKALKLTAKGWRLALASFIGAICAVAFPFLKLGVALGFLLKLPVGLAVVFASGEFRSFKEYLRCFCLFLSFTFLSGGAVTAIFWGLGLSFDPVSYAHGEQIPLFIILVIVIAVCLGLKRLIKILYQKRAVARFAVKCAVQIGGKVFETDGYFDSGNQLVYRETNGPIALCSKKFTSKLILSGALDLVESDVIAINTVSGKSFIEVYKTQRFLIYNGDEPNILYNVMLGTTTSELFCGNEYDLLLGVKFGEVV